MMETIYYNDYTSEHNSIVPADNLSLALEYKNDLTKLIGKGSEFISEISSIVAIHSGLGCVAVCFTKE
jgi:fatty acid-binding protein DegV